jgi:hypothetical protein
LFSRGLVVQPAISRSKFGALALPAALLAAALVFIAFSATGLPKPGLVMGQIGVSMLMSAANP